MGGVIIAALVIRFIILEFSSAFTEFLGNNKTTT